MQTEIVRKLGNISDFDLPEVVSKCAEIGALSKADIGDVLNRRAMEKRLPAETFQQSFNNCFAVSNPRDPAGQALLGIMMKMSGPDHRVAKTAADT